MADAGDFGGVDVSQVKVTKGVGRDGMAYTSGLEKNADFSHSPAQSYSLGSTGSLSKARTPKTHS